MPTVRNLATAPATLPGLADARAPGRVPESAVSGLAILVGTLVGQVVTDLPAALILISR